MNNLSQTLPREPWVQTYSGKCLTPLRPLLDDITLVDIAIGLAREPRFSGQSSKTYRVGQHSVLVSQLCEERWGRRISQYGLLHDASEGLSLRDISRAIKHSPEFEFYRDAEYILQTAIYSKFGLFEPEPPEVKIADDVWLATESYSFMNPVLYEVELKQKPLPIKIRAWSERKTLRKFLNRFEELFGKGYV